MKSLHPVALRLLLLVAAMLLSHCTGLEQTTLYQAAPLDDSYPELEYLTVIRNADNADTAVQSALQSLQNSFAVNHIVGSQQARITQDLQAHLRIDEQAIKRHLSRTASALAEKIQLAKQWQTGQQHFALAVLAKDDSRAIVYPQIRELNETIRQQFQTTANSNNPLQQWQALPSIMQQQMELDTLNRLCSQLGIAPQAGNYSLQQLQQYYRQLLPQISVDVRSNSSTIRDSLEKNIRALGFTLDKPARYTLSGMLDSTSIEKINDHYRFQGAYVLRLMQDETLLSEQRFPLDLSNPDREQLKQLTSDTINAALAENMSQLFQTVQ